MNAIELMASRLLGTGGAVSLRARRAGRLEVVAGTVWVTRSSADAADHVLHGGQTLTVRRGDRLVVERWQRDECVELRFSADAVVRPGVRATVRALQSQARRLLSLAAQGLAGVSMATAECLRASGSRLSDWSRRQSAIASGGACDAGQGGASAASCV